MAQVTTGVRAIFSLPHIYDFAQNLVGAERARAILVRDHLKPQSGQRLLDIGCGTARLLPHLPADTTYVGVDLSQDYIDSARRAYAERGTFLCVDIGQADPAAFRNFDLVFATGLLHHLDDEVAHAMLVIAHKALADGGRLVTSDPCFANGQSPFARAIIERDRGRNVRTAEAYAELARSVFQRVRVDVRSDLIRIPYTHAIVECHK
jgi:SAM-dependent methyltransferase